MPPLDLFRSVLELLLRPLSPASPPLTNQKRIYALFPWLYPGHVNIYRGKEDHWDSRSSAPPPDLVPPAVGAIASPSWPFSNSSKTRSLAAALTLVRSSSASFFIPWSLSFCLLMSFFCITCHQVRSWTSSFIWGLTEVGVNAFFAKQMTFVTN